MASRSRRAGLTDYSQTRASVKPHATYIKRTFLGASSSSLFDEEDDFLSDRPAWTMQQFRESLIRPEDEEGEVTFQIRGDRKRWRNGSTHSLSKGRYIYSQDDQGHYSKVSESPKTPSRSFSGKSKIVVSGPSQDSLGQSTEDISAYGYGPTSPCQGSNRENVRMDNAEGPKQPSLPTLEGILGGELPVSESEQTETSASEQSFTYEIASDSTQSASLSSCSSALSGLRKGRYKSSEHETSSQNGNPMMPAHLQTSFPSISEDNSEEEEKPTKEPPKRERPIFAGFGSNGYIRSYPIRNPSDSDESFTSFAQKYSRFSKPAATPKAQKSDADSCMDLHESFSSFASFAEDEEWATKPKGDKLLDGDEESEEGSEDEDDISLGDQSPDSVIVDLTSVSTSVNSNSQSLSLSLSPRSSSKASMSRERRSVVPLNDITGARQKRDEKRMTRHRRDGTDGCSVTSGISRHSNHSVGSWFSRHSKKSTNSRFSRLEEYLNKDSNKDCVDGSKEASSRVSNERKDDMSTTSSITMGTFRTHETKDSWKKLSDVVESREIPNPGASKEDGASLGAALKHINSNPFLAADRRNNIPIKDSYDSPRKANKVWKPPQSPETTSPTKTWPTKATPRNMDLAKHLQSPVKTPGSSPRKLAAIGNCESPAITESPAKTPATTPRKLSLDRLSPFANARSSVPDVTRAGVARGKSYESSAKRPLSSTKAPDRSASSDGKLGGLREIACAPLSSPRRAVKSVFSPLPGGDVVPDENPETTKAAGRSGKKATVPSSVYTTPEPELSTQDLTNEKNNVSAVAPFSKMFQQPVQPLNPTKAVNNGINLFNPSATSKGPTKQNFPRFVGDHVNPGPSPVKSSTKVVSSPDLKPVPVQIDFSEDAESKKVSCTSAPKKLSKVQSYLKRCKEQNADAVEPSPQSPKKDNGNTAAKGIVRSPTKSKGSSIKPSSDPVLSSVAPPQKKSENPKKPSRQGPVASRVRIDLFLEKNKKGVGEEEDDVFKEPVPSPWRPSTTSGRNRLRGSDSNSRASSIASSKCSTTSARTGALSMFQPHVLPGIHSPTRASGSKNVVSFDVSKGSKPKSSLVEQRKRMLQSGNQSKAQGNTSSPGSSKESPMTSITKQIGDDDNNMLSLPLPSANEISCRVSTWHNTALLAD
eukprot:scaffold2081_cov255-Amphora_coffeaeformis.AAC.5